MYFNLITLIPGREQQAMQEWPGRALRPTAPYREHQWLWQFFPAAEGSARDFLFRREDRNAQLRFYVVSKRPARSPSTAWAVQTREYRPKLETGDHLRFTLRANPVVTAKRGDDENKKSVRHDVVMHEKKRLLREKGLQKWSDLPENERPPLYDLVRQTCGAWLEKCAVERGFIVHSNDENFAVDSYQPLKLYAANKKKQDSHAEKEKEKNHEEDIRFSRVDFSGILTITEPESFQKALMDGIGPAKAFGCGLLLVRPL
ncbi:MAG: type I-E CRISPR-associated protein Cas6/Cse3/CasE [Azoarcus sp.]|jgi:CRISPR system Cascade subunit CasE|nr:type I-E CRISPR-associated protein Cas6/Cse3/CasE [Azoarcus sp.]